MGYTPWGYAEWDVTEQLKGHRDGVRGRQGRVTRANEENSVASRDSQSLLHLRITWEDVKSPGVHVWTKYVNVFTGETQASGCFKILGGFQCAAKIMNHGTSTFSRQGAQIQSLSSLGVLRTPVVTCRSTGAAGKGRGCG